MYRTRLKFSFLKSYRNASNLIFLTSLNTYYTNKKCGFERLPKNFQQKNLILCRALITSVSAIRRSFSSS